MVSTVKNRFGYDDTLDAFGVHGAGGTLGAILTGVFATNLINDGLKDPAGKLLPLGWIDGNPDQVLNQLTAVVISWVLAVSPRSSFLKSWTLPSGFGHPSSRSAKDSISHARRRRVQL